MLRLISFHNLKYVLHNNPVWLWALLLFAPIVIVGLINAPDYGLAWDEPAQREIGTVSYNYLFHGDKTLHTYRDQDYGVGFELPLIILEKALGLQSEPTIFKMRHAVSHLFFLFCLYCGFLLIYKLFGSFWIATTGVLFFIFHPVLYAHSFFNTKDIPFMGMSLVCFLLMLNAFRTNRYSHFVVLGACIGYLTNLRLMGILLLVIALTLIAVDFIRLPKSDQRKDKVLRGGMLMLLVFGAVLYLSWPYLYESPYDKFVGAFKNMSKFRWRYEVLYFGEMIPATQLPWHYIPVSMSITTPIVFLLLGISGAVWATVRLITKPAALFSTETNRMLLVFLGCVFLPLFAVIMLKSVVYDSWRHLFFIYSPMVILAMYFLSGLKKRNVRYLTWTLIGFTFVGSGFFMIRHHPHQHVYFNALMYSQKENHFRHHFEMDYWGVSYLDAIHAVLNLEEQKQIEVNFATASGIYNVENMLNQSDKQRIIITEENPKYFITGYRFHPYGYDFEDADEVYKVEVGNNTVVSVFKLRE